MHSLKGGGCIGSAQSSTLNDLLHLYSGLFLLNQWLRYVLPAAARACMQTLTGAGSGAVHFACRHQPRQGRLPPAATLLQVGGCSGTMHNRLLQAVALQLLLLSLGAHVQQLAVKVSGALGACMQRQLD